MATKEDILEQIVEEYLTHKGYFVRHNIKFLPRRDHPEFVLNQHSNHSDIDVIGYHPRLPSENGKVMVVSCKSWQGGFNPASHIRAIEGSKKAAGRAAWKSFRELTSPIWADAFVHSVVEAAGTDKFTYVTAVAKLTGDRRIWEEHEPFRKAIGGNPITIITFGEMIDDIQLTLTKTVASTEVGRMLQMFRAGHVALNGVRSKDANSTPN